MFEIDFDKNIITALGPGHDEYEGGYMEWLQVVISGFFMLNNIEIVDDADYHFCLNCEDYVLSYILINMEDRTISEKNIDIMHIYPIKKCSTMKELEKLINIKIQKIHYTNVLTEKYEEKLSKLKKYKKEIKYLKKKLAEYE